MQGYMSLESNISFEMSRVPTHHAPHLHTSLEIERNCTKSLFAGSMIYCHLFGFEVFSVEIRVTCHGLSSGSRNDAILVTFLFG